MEGGHSKDQAKIGALIRKRRLQLSLTLQQLGDKSGVSFSYLSQVERNNATPTLGTLAQVAQALGVGIDFFIKTPRPADSVTRAAQRAHFSINNSALSYERLGAEVPGNELSSFIIHVPAGFQSEIFQHEGEEIIYVLEGTISQMVDGTAFDLNVGDSIHYQGSHPHSYSNFGDTTARLLWAGTLKLFHTPGGGVFATPANTDDISSIKDAK
jgi:transcriptional regulator with XRE-family HTH domain